MNADRNYQTAHSSKIDLATQENLTSTPNWDQLNLDRHLQQAFKASLQQQLSPPAVQPNTATLTQMNAEFIAEILSSKNISHQTANTLLEDIFNVQKTIYQQVDIAPPLRKRQYINKTGLVMSPDHCITTLRDTLRVGRFIKGVDQAIHALMKKHKTLRIVYPACGPFAPLLLPLLSYYQQCKIYSAAQLQVTLIDIQEGATETLKALISAHGIEGYIEKVLCQDAADHHSDAPYDLILLEAMQHGFSREGHLRLARHFASYLKTTGFFIPQKIVLSTSLNSAQHEYIEQWKNNDAITQQQLCDARIQLGELLIIDQAFLRNLQPIVLDDHTELVKCNTLNIPQISNTTEAQTLLINSRLNIFGDLWLEEYESGITHPLPDQNVCINFTPRDPQPSDLMVKSGEAITFYYCMNGLPGFFATRATSESEKQSEENPSALLEY